LKQEALNINFVAGPSKKSTGTLLPELQTLSKPQMQSLHSELCVAAESAKDPANVSNFSAQLGSGLRT
jgi:hypothetical protein